MQSEVFKDKRFVKNIGKLFGGSFIAQLIPFFILPFLSRIFSPEDFGFWAYFLSLSGIMSIIMTGNYEFAIVLPKENKEAVNVTSGAILLSLLIFLFGLLLIPLVNSLVLKGIDIKSDNYAYVISICIMALFMALFRILNYWNNRKNRFHTTAYGNISRSFSVSALQLLNGLYFLKNYTGLVISSVLGYVLGTLVQSKNLMLNINKHKNDISLSSITASLRRYKDFPKYFMPSEFMNYLSSNVPVIFLTNMFDSTVAGLYAIPQKFINTPLTLLGSSISQAYYKKTTDLKNNNEDISRLTTEIYKKLFMLGIIPLSIVAGYGDHIFEIFLGDKWADSGLYAALLAPWMLMVFASSPISIVFATLEKQKTSLKLNLFLLTVRILSFMIGGMIFKSAFTAVLLFGLSGFIYWMYLSFFIIKTAGGDRYDIVKFTITKLTYIMLPIILSRTVIECMI